MVFVASPWTRSPWRPPSASGIKVRNRGSRRHFADTGNMPSGRLWEASLPFATLRPGARATWEEAQWDASHAERTEIWQSARAGSAASRSGDKRRTARDESQSEAV